MEQFSTSQTLGDILYPGFWLVENFSTVRCICFHWPLYPQINFQPIRTCLTHAQFRVMTVGHVSFRWTCIVLHSVLLNIRRVPFQAVCCADGKHCCPHGKSCDPASETCKQRDFRVEWVKKSPAQLETESHELVEKSRAQLKIVPCPGGRYECQDGQVCCPQPSGGYGCCTTNYVSLASMFAVFVIWMCWCKLQLWTTSRILPVSASYRLKKFSFREFWCQYHVILKSRIIFEQGFQCEYSEKSEINDWFKLIF